MVGRVFLVGAGPGAPDLLTLRGLAALQAADVIVVDTLVPPDYLQGLPLDLAGKRVVRLSEGSGRWSQERINREVTDYALAGRTVARLKGGDPGVFGRLAEELSAMRSAGLEAEAIPGPSVATAAATAAGLPLTVRGSGRSFACATARATGGGIVPTLPQADTLAIYMGIEAAPAIRDRLLAQGWSPETPVRVVERATMAYESLHHCTIDDLHHCVAANEVRSPALLVVGAGAAQAADECAPVVIYTGNQPMVHRGLGHLLHWPMLKPLVAENRPGVATMGVVAGEFPPRLPKAHALLFEAPEEVRPLLDSYGLESLPSAVWCVRPDTLEMALSLGVEAVLLSEARSQSCLRSGYSRSTSRSKA